MAVLQGESLLNDAVALLVFGLALAAAVAPGNAWEALAPRLLIAVPGGAALGVLTAVLAMRLSHRVAGTLSMIIVQFLITYGTWILAERLQVSPIVAVVALAGVAAWYAPARTSARDRINTNAVWATVVFVLNVLAFLLMGLQARVILSQMQGAALTHALAFSAIVLGVVIGVRFAYVMLYGFVLRAFRTFFEERVLRAKVPSAKIGVLVSWCGMRGLVSMATALALPPQFPGRDVIVLSAFIVVLGTLILQGFTMRPLIALLQLAPDSSLDEDVAQARIAMLEAALEELAGVAGDGAAALRAEYGAARAGSVDRSRPNTAYDQMRMQAIGAERRLLIDWRRQGRIPDDAYHVLEDELDRAELHSALLRNTWLED
jgi:CPA1 family monovalent cation:H+ antiporter